MAKFYVDSSGKYLGAFDGWVDNDGDLHYPVPPENAVEVPDAPNHGLDTWDAQTKSWIPYAEPYTEKRKEQYTEIGLPDQIDALFKVGLFLFPKLLAAGVITQQEYDELAPDASKPADTPAGWLGKIAKIKSDFPKE